MTLTTEAKQWLGQLDNRAQASTAEKGVCVDEDEDDEVIEPLETVDGTKLTDHVAKVAVLFHILFTVLKCSLHTIGCVEVPQEIPRNTVEMAGNLGLYLQKQMAYRLQVSEFSN